MYIKNLYFIVIIIIYATSAFTTPDPGLKRREIFLGANDTHYFCLIQQTSQPGSHHVRYDSTMFCKYDITSAEIIESILLRAIKYYYSFDENIWEMQDELKDSLLNFQQFLFERKAYNVYPSRFFEDFLLIIDNNGLTVDKRDGDKIVLLDVEQFKKLSNQEWIDGMKVLTYYESDNNLFLLIQYGDFCCSDGFSYQLRQ